MWQNPAPMTTRKVRRCCALASTIAVAVELGSAPCLASSVVETIGAPGVGNGFSARVLGRGAEVTYYNPSLMPDASADLSFGVLLLGTSSNIHLDPRPSGVDVPDSIYQADLARLPASGRQLWPQSTARLLHRRADTVTRDVTPYVALGLVRPLVRDVLLFGFYAQIPTTGFLQADGFFSDEREQYFSNQLHAELLGDRLKVPTLAAALGGRLLPELSWGAGLDIGMATRTEMQIYVPNAADESNLLIVPKIETRIAAAPHLGLALRPYGRLLVTATLHLPKSWDTNGQNRIRFFDYTYPSGQTAVVQSYTLTQGNEPLRIGLGVGTGGKSGTIGWEIGLQGVFTQWSQYLDRHGERPLDAWHDTVNVGVGWALNWAERRLTAELGVAPTPVPVQSGRTNYVDSTRLVSSVGFERPFQWWTTKYAIGIHVQAQFIVPRSVTKRPDAANPVTDELPDSAVDRVSGLPLSGAPGLQSNNPGYPGYRSWGTILGAAMVLKVLR
jgi:long-chain fatty acid transport protein